MPANNALLYNAALEGFIAGEVKDRWLTAVNAGTPPVIGTPDPSYTALVGQSALFAVECDSKIPTDDAASPQPAGSTAISVITTGVAIAPTTGAIQSAQLAKTKLMAAITLGIIEGRYYGQPAVLQPADFSSVVTASLAAYLQLAAQVQNLTNTNNEVIFFGANAGLLAGMFSASPGTFAADEFTLVIQFASALATAIDAGIPNDTAMSANNGVALPANTNGAVQQGQLAKQRLIYSICLAVMQQRNPLSNLTVLQNPTPWITANSPQIIAAYKAISPSLISTPLDATPPFNPILWNEAFNGFVSAKFADRPITSASVSDPNYLAVAAAAVQFANAIDGAVGGSDVVGTPIPTGTAPITTVGETVEALPPATGPNQEGDLGKAGIMWAICRGTQHGRPLLGTVQDTEQSTYTRTAKSIVALYLVASEALTTP